MVIKIKRLAICFVEIYELIFLFNEIYSDEEIYESSRWSTDKSR